MSKEEIKVGDMVFYPEAPDVYYKVVGVHNNLLWVVYEKNGHYRTAMKSEVRLADLRGNILRALRKHSHIVQHAESCGERSCNLLGGFWITFNPGWYKSVSFDNASLAKVPRMIEDLIALWDDVRPLVVDECAKKSWVPCEKDGGK